MNPLARRLLLALVSAVFAVAAANAADVYPELQAGNQVYRDVQVLSANASSLSIRHAGGISQVPLSALSPELQARYGYDPQAAAERKERLVQERDARVVREEKERQERARQAKQAAARRQSERLGQAFAAFGQPPKLLESVDLREEFRKRSLSVRNQGIRPSCAIHSIVAAIEYQYAERQGEPLDLSETYLLRATYRSLGRVYHRLNDWDSDSASLASAAAAPADEGFTLEQVLQAIRGYGLARENADIDQLELSQVERLDGLAFSAYIVPGGRSRAGLANMIHVLNARMPLVVGLAWPADSFTRNTSLISKQVPAPGAGHAVTIVGYQCPSGRLEDTTFIFRNSWGARWGAGGYGFVTYAYLAQHLFSCYVVELR